MPRAPSRPTVARMQLTELESRLAPAVTVRFDYAFDRTGFFSDPVRRAALESAAAEIGPHLNDNLAAIIPSGSNTWKAMVVDPTTNTTRNIENAVIAENEVVVFVGAVPIGAGELGIATTGGFSAAGNRTWLELVRSRGQAGALATPRTDYAPWGGSIAFDSTTNWYFGTGTPPPGQYDFSGVALHELMHIFGFGLGEPAFMRHVSDNRFTGPAVRATAGGPVLLDSDSQDHWAHGMTYGGRESPMQAALTPGVRRTMTPVEYAVLADVGWDVVGVPGLGAYPVSPAAPVSVTPQDPVPPGWFAAGTASEALLYDDDGEVRVRVTPFPGYAGGVRVAAADVTGDGTPDLIAGTGPGVVAEVRVIDGVTRRQVMAFIPFEETYAGGVFVADGDVTGDGRPDVVVTPDQSGGPVVVVYDGAAMARGAAVEVTRFFGIADPNFRGGARAAVGDVNGDHVADVVVAAGYGGGPRVAVFDGRSVRAARPTALAPDFFAFEPTLRNGAYVAVVDLDGDGTGEVVAGAGPGGAPRVTAFRGTDLLAGRRGVAADFFAGEPATRGGVRLAVADPNGDGRPDLLTGAGAGGNTVRVFDTGGLGRGTFNPWLAYTATASSADGIYVG